MRITLRELRNIIRETIENTLPEAARDKEAEQEELELRKQFRDLGMDTDTRMSSVRKGVAANKRNAERPFSLNKDDYR